jgi:hypothetical protein
MDFPAPAMTKISNCVATAKRISHGGLRQPFSQRNELLAFDQDLNSSESINQDPLLSS